MASASSSVDKKYVLPKQLEGDYPLIDGDPHIKRVFRYARPSDYAEGAALGAFSPLSLLVMEKLSPSYVGRGGFPPMLRLSYAVGISAAFFMTYQRSYYRFLGITENSREVDMDMREMVDKVKRGEPLYGKSQLSDHMQGVAARNSRNAGLWVYFVPWFNFVNHNQHGIDTAKYYRQAEREMEAERHREGAKVN